MDRDRLRRETQSDKAQRLKTVKAPVDKGIVRGGISSVRSLVPKFGIRHPDSLITKDPKMRDLYVPRIKRR